MNSIANEPSIVNDEMVNVNRKAIEHRATWMGLSYEAALASGIDGERLLRTAVSRTGQLHGRLIKLGIQKPVRMDEFADAFLSPVAIRTFEMEFCARTADVLDIRFHYCPLVAGWLKAGIPVDHIPKLCDIAMDGDRNIAGTAGAGFSLGKTIASGDSVCEVRFFKTSHLQSDS
jgi:hypothetical protein